MNRQRIPLRTLAVSFVFAAGCGDYYEHQWGEMPCERDADCPEQFYCHSDAEVCVHEDSEECPWLFCGDPCTDNYDTSRPEPGDAGTDLAPPPSDAGVDSSGHDAHDAQGPETVDATPDAINPDASVPDAVDPDPADVSLPDTTDPDAPSGPECLRNRDCDEGELCIDATCVDPDAGQCERSSDCAEGEGCVDAMCRFPCTCDADCGSEETCVVAFCIPSDAPSSCEAGDSGCGLP